MKAIKYILLSLLFSTPLTSVADDYPDRVKNRQMDVDHPVIGLLSDSKSVRREIGVTAYHNSGVYTVPNRGFSKGKISYKYYQKDINGVLNGPDDIDLIPVRIPKNKYPHIKLSVENDVYSDGYVKKMIVPKDPSQTYNPLLTSLDKRKNILKHFKISDLWKDFYTGEVVGGSYYGYGDPRSENRTFTEGYDNTFNTVAETIMANEYDGELYYIMVYQPYWVQDYSNSDIDYTVNVSLTEFPSLERPLDFMGESMISFNRGFRAVEQVSMESSNGCPDGIFGANVKLDKENGCFHFVRNSDYPITEPRHIRVPSANSNMKELLQTIRNDKKNAQRNRERELENHVNNFAADAYKQAYDTLLKKDTMLSFENFNSKTPLLDYDYNGVDLENVNKLKIKVHAPFNNTDPFKKQTLSVSVNNSRTGEEKTLSAKEVDCLSLESSKNAECFYISMPYQKSQEEQNKQAMSVLDGDELNISAEYEYKNPYFNELDRDLKVSAQTNVHEVPQKALINFSGANEQENKIVFNNELSITISDADKNKDTESQETIEAKIFLNSEDSAADFRDTETMALEETGPNTGQFQIQLEMDKVEDVDSIDKENGKLEGFSGDEVAVVYDDERLYSESAQKLLNDNISNNNSSVSNFINSVSDRDIISKTINQGQKIILPKTADINVNKDGLLINDSFSISIADCGIVGEESKKIKVINKTQNKHHEFDVERKGFSKCQVGKNDIDIISSEYASDYEGEMFVAGDVGDEIIIKWLDELNNNAEKQTVEEKTTIVGAKGSDASAMMRLDDGGSFLQLDDFPSDIVLTGGAQTINFQVVDEDLNKSSTKKEQYEIQVENDSTGEVSTFLISEECKDCTEFVGELNISNNEEPDQGVISAEDGESVSIIYEDKRTHDGNVKVHKKSLNVVKSDEMAIVFDNEFSVGQFIKSNMEDDDLKFWEGFYGYGVLVDKKVRVINKTKGYEFNYEIDETQNSGESIKLRPYDIASAPLKDKGHEGSGTVFVYVESGDVLEFIIEDKFGPNKNSEQIVFQKTVKDNYLNSNVDLYSEDFDINETPEIRVYDAKANLSSNERDEVSVSLTYDDFSESETLTLTETEKDSGEFRTDVELEEADQAVIGDGVVQYPTIVKKQPESYRENIDIDYEDMDGNNYSINQYFTNRQYPLTLNVTPEDLKLGDKVKLELDEPLNDREQVYIDIKVEVDGDIIKNYVFPLSRQDDGVYKSEFFLAPFSESEYSETECNAGGGIEPLSLGENPVENEKNNAGAERSVKATDLPPEGPPSPPSNVFCAQKGADILFDYRGETQKEYQISESSAAGISIEVDDNILVEDEIDVKVHDFMANQNSNEKDSVSINVVSAIFETNTPKDMERELVLEETEKDSGVFTTKVDVTEREGDKDTSYYSDNGVIDTKITKFQAPEEKLDFLYISMLGEFQTVQREVLGGDDAVLSAPDSKRINNNITVQVNDLDENKNSGGKNDVIDIKVVNQRTQQQKTYSATEKESEGVFDVQFPVTNEQEKTSNSIVAKPSDSLMVSYIDEKGRLLKQSTLKETIEIKGGNDAILEVSAPVYINGKVFVAVEDLDESSQTKGDGVVNVVVENERTNETVSLELEEVSNNNGVFEGELSAQYSESTLNSAGKIGVQKKDKLIFEYIDKENSSGSEETLIKQRNVVAGVDSTVVAQDTVNVRGPVSVRVNDSDLNKNEFSEESVTVRAENRRTGETTDLDLVEKSASSDTFKGKLRIASQDQSNAFKVQKDDIIDFTYEDSNTSKGTSKKVIDKTNIINVQDDGFDGILSVEETISANQQVTVSVEDKDLNTDKDEKETAEVLVLNERTQETMYIEVVEVGADNSVFEGEFEVQRNKSPISDNSIMGVLKDDTLNFNYFDNKDSDGNRAVREKQRVVVDELSRSLDVEKPLTVSQKVSVNVNDPSKNNDAEVVEQVDVLAENVNTGQQVQLTLNETGSDEGAFVIDLQSQYSKGALDSETVMGVEKDDIVEFRYSYGGDTPIIVERIAIAGVDAILNINPNKDGRLKVNEPITVQVDDADRNKNPESAESINVRVKNKNTSQTIKAMTLFETDSDTGVFEARLPTTYSRQEVTSTSELGVKNGDNVEFRYIDTFTSKGETNVPIEVNKKALGGADGEITVSSPNEIGQAMQVSVSDRDLDVSDAKDTVVVSVENERTGDEVSVELTETGGATHTFTGNVFGVNEAVRDDNDRIQGASQQAKTLTTRTGDYLEAVYVDEMNANGNEEELSDKGLFLGEDAIVIDKQAQKESVVVGDFVPYQVSIENTSPNDLANLTIIDTLPSGFRMAKDKVYVGDETRDISASGGILSVYLDEIESGEVIDMTYVLKPSSGVVEGVYKNEIEPFISDIVVGNKAQASVRIDDDPLFSDALVFGKVFHDKNGNGYQDKGENGIAGVTIAGVDGMNVVTDSKGRFHIEAVDGGRMERGRNYILKVMPKSLPDGATMTTENPRVRRITQGMPAKFNFGVKLPERGAYQAKVEIHLAEVFFDWDKDKVKDQYKDELKKVASVIEQKGGGVIIIEGNTDSLGTDEYNQDLGLRRASAVYQILKEHLSDRVYQNLEVKISDGESNKN